MKKLSLLFLLYAMISCSSLKKDDASVTIHIDPIEEGGVATLKAEIIADDIIRIQSSPESEIPQKKSLVIDPNFVKKQVKWDVKDEEENIVLETSKLRLKINKNNGKIDFFNLNGDTLLSESKTVHASFIPVQLNGEKRYKIRQVFDSPNNEAFYGLGQHQNGEVNYKGKDVDLMQHNIVAVVPFLVSNKNYGILWDNYSRTKFGDPRDYKQISYFKLYNESGQPGGLTARYYNDREKMNLVHERIEDTVYYKYLDQQKSFPENFSPMDGLVEWNGYIESEESGIFKLLFYSAGYAKLRINNELITDSWRQCWNPWYRKYSIELNAGEKIPISIEWIPDGKESYISLECLSPYNLEMQNKQSWFSEAGKTIDYYFVKGDNPDDVISGYREITGKSPIMPIWAMGLWQSRERYKTQEEILNVVNEYRKRKIPLDNIVVDWHYWEEDKWGDHGFDYERFPDPVAMNKELHDELNTHVMISVWPKYYENTKNYKIMQEKGYIYMENINNRQKDWVGPGYVSSFYDAFNPEARDLYWKQLNDSLFSKGFDAWWLDATEPDILSNSSIEAQKRLMDPSIGSSTEYLNVFSLVQAGGVYTSQRKVEPNKRVFILTRSAFAGQQRYAAATWSGDIVSRWRVFKEQIAAGVNISISGIPYWTTDIGGFALEKRYEEPGEEDLNEWRELNLRWFQFGAFSPLFRIHGQFPFREIYNISPAGHPVYESMVYYDKLRYRLMPYIYSLSGMTYHKDFTIMRPLVMDFGYDHNVLDINDQYMFGKSIMVCPVTEYEAIKREVYFPDKIDWYDLISGKHFTGGSTYTVDAPLKKIPVFVPSGTVLPIGPEIFYTDEKLADPIEIYVFKGADGSFTLYEDEGTNYNYEKGSYSLIELKYLEDEQKIIIGKRVGQFPGMLKERTFTIKLISPEAGKGIESKDIQEQTVSYNGDVVIVQL